jgi:hypothetical protein
MQFEFAPFHSRPLGGVLASAALSFAASPLSSGTVRNFPLFTRKPVFVKILHRRVLEKFLPPSPRQPNAWQSKLTSLRLLSRMDDIERFVVKWSQLVVTISAPEGV